MRVFHRIDRVARLEEAVKWQIAERDRKAREEEVSRLRYMQTLQQACAVRTPILRSAVERAEEPYQALLNSPEWLRTLAAISTIESTPMTAVNVPVEAGLRQWTLSFGPSVILKRKVHYMAPVMTALKVEGTLIPVISWWEEGRSVPQETGSPLVSLGDRMAAFGTVFNLCLLLRRGSLLRVIQSAYLRRIEGSRWRRLAGTA